MSTEKLWNYINRVLSGEKKVGVTERSCVERFMDDIEKSKTDEFLYYFDEDVASRHIDIANTLTIVEGSEPVSLRTRGFQDFIIANIFGWMHKERNERRYREAYIQIGRQNGKSFLSGFLGVDFASFCGYNYGRVYCAATKQEQANIVWDEMAKFISADEDLDSMHKIRVYDRRIISYLTNTEIKAVGRDTKSADGFRSILAIVDEYHAHPTNQMYKLLLDGQIKVDSALTCAITTAGFNLNSPCYQQYQMCKKILKRAITKDTLFIFICEMDENDDIWEPTNWAKSNPLILWKDDDSYDEHMLARMAEKAIDAKEKGGSELCNFMTKSLNYWVTNGGDALVDAQKWVECGCDMTLEDMRGKECRLGIDLSSGGDLTSISLIFKLEGDIKYIYSHSFMPKLRLAEHEHTDEVPYRMWVNEGLLTLTDGGFGVKTDYQYILSHLAEIITKYNLTILSCGYDAHNAGVFLSPLDEVLGGAPLVEIKQSARSLSDATIDFQLTVKGGLVRYDRRNELLTWSVLNAILTYNSFGECKVEKNTATRRIDPVDAVIDAWKLAMVVEDDVDINAEVDAWLNMIGGSNA